MSATARLPVLGVLPPLARILLLATLGVSVVAIVLDWGVGADPTLVFVVAGIAILGLAWIIGLATERLGALSGPQVGGILNATFGNIAELIIAFFALREGLIEVVKASLTGSIIGNLLLVLGASVLVGGLRNGIQRFDARIAGSNAALLVVAAIGFFVPAIFAFSAGSGEQGTITEESVLVSVLLIAGYVLSLVFSFTNSSRTLGGHEPAAEHGGPAWGRGVAVGVLLATAALLAVLSEILVGAIEPFIETFGLSTFFDGRDEPDERHAREGQQVGPGGHPIPTGTPPRLEGGGVGRRRTDPDECERNCEQDRERQPGGTRGSSDPGADRPGHHRDGRRRGRVVGDGRACETGDRIGAQRVPADQSAASQDLPLSQ
jgi:hypothetical protein